MSWQQPQQQSLHQRVHKGFWGYATDKTLRQGMTLAEAERWLAPVLGYEN
ncbi:MAG: hypothetical protein JG718_09570 [Candidatus Thiothrix moscowensis]|nr:hypothetical protein [Candidatus Thiothrix moscowensis]